MAKMGSLSSNNDKIYRTRIILASCYPLILQCLKTNIEKQQDMELIAETGDSEEAINLATMLRPDIVVIDIDMPRIDGLEAVKRIIESSPRTKNLILTRNNDDNERIRQAGICTFLSKRSTIELVFRTLRDMAAGKAVSPTEVIPDFITDDLHLSPSVRKIHFGLTSKEEKIFKLVARGKPNKAIALKLGLSLANVKATLTDIFFKLGVSSRTEAVSFGLKNGIITINDLDDLN